MINALTEILDSSCVNLDIRGRKKPEIIRELVELLAQAGKVDDPQSTLSMILERESMATTGIGGGIAIPHCMSPQIREMALAFGRHPTGVKFDAVDRRPVQLVFLVVAPNNAHTEHLQVLSKISRYLHDPNFKRSLLEASTPEEVVQLFADREK
ncbi:MAG: PTS sugar transporter subunit IIA [Spirochaetota bacterium]